MTTADLLTSIGISTLAVSSIGWLLRAWISARLVAAVTHEFESKLEGVRSENRKEEERLRAQLVEREAETAALQSGAMSALQARQAARAERQLWAVEAIWSFVSSRAKLKYATRVMQSINFDEAVREAPKNANVRAMFQDIRASFIEEGAGPSEQSERIAKCRLHVAPLTWALFRAHETVTGFAATKIMMLSEGSDSLHLFDEAHMVGLVKAALPHQSDLIDERGLHFLDYLVDEIEDALFRELRSELRGSGESAGAVAQAAEILQQANAAAGAQGIPELNTSPLAKRPSVDR